MPRLALGLTQRTRDCRFLLCSKRLPRLWPYPKPFNKTLRSSLAFGFFVSIGASLEEFANDVRAILDAKLMNP